MTHNTLKKIALTTAATTLLITTTTHAASPVWTFTPLTATTQSVPASGSITVEYLLTSQSRKPHSLILTPTPGVTQNTTAGKCANPATLTYLQFCTLSLDINGNTLQGNLTNGPTVCEQGNPNQCYQPSQADSLNITRTTAPGQTTLQLMPITSTLPNNETLSLSVKDTALNLALTGAPRTLTIKNNGPTPAINVHYTPNPALPSDATITPITCGTMAPNDTCTLTITPGGTPTAPPGTTTPTPITLTITGDNTSNQLNPMINILTYGSVYQGGYVYSVDDAQPTTGSIGGKVLALMDNADSSTGIQWSNGSPMLINASNFYNGAPNTTVIIASQGTGSYAASTCAIYKTNALGAACTPGTPCFDDWYLPAICEMGPDSNGSGCTVGTQNIVDQLPGLLGASCSFGSPHCLQSSSVVVPGAYWSSTELSGGPQYVAWGQYFAASGGSNQGAGNKNDLLGVRCSRALSI